jgi:hypothetical protein
MLYLKLNIPEKNYGHTPIHASQNQMKGLYFHPFWDITKYPPAILLGQCLKRLSRKLGQSCQVMRPHLCDFYLSPRMRRLYFTTGLVTGENWWAIRISLPLGNKNFYYFQQRSKG